MKYLFESRVTALLVACCSLNISTAFAETTTLPPCTLADINQAISTSTALTCSTDGTIFFGTDITQFIVASCSTLTTPGESAEDIAKGKAACIRCAKGAAISFQAAAKARLITPNSSSHIDKAKIKQLCNIADSGEGNDNGGQTTPNQSDAVQNMYNQLRLCLPQDSQAIDATQCQQCATTILDKALTDGVINQSKHDVISKSVAEVCTHKKGEGTGGGDEHPSPSPTVAPTGAPTGAPTAEPTPSDGGNGNTTWDKFFASIRSCVGQYHTPTNNDVAGCLSCLDAVPTTGLDQTKVGVSLGYAKSICNGTFVPHEPTATPTPGTGDNSGPK